MHSVRAQSFITLEFGFKLKGNHHPLINWNFKCFHAVHFPQAAPKTRSHNIAAGIHDELLKETEIDMQRNTPLTGHSNTLFDILLFDFSVTGVIHDLCKQINHRMHLLWRFRSIANVRYCVLRIRFPSSDVASLSFTSCG